MPIDEPQPEFSLEISKETQRTIQGKLMSSGVAGVLSLIPGVGGAVTEMLTELAIQRTNNRMKEMFEHFTNTIRDIGEDKVDREWFRSEEFQTLLYEGIQQLHVTYDRKKIEMLGVALANSGTQGFKNDERKDLFIQFVRDLTRQHLKVLVELAPNPLESYDQPPLIPGTQLPEKPLDDETIRWLTWKHRPIKTAPQNDDLLALQMLHAYGLVEETINTTIEEPRTPVRITSESQINSAVREFVKNVMNPIVTRSFRLSRLGDEFLRFTGLPRRTTKTEAF